MRQWLALGATTGVIYRTRNLRSLQENPSCIPSYRFLASCYAHLGKLDEARELIRPGRALAAGRKMLFGIVVTLAFTVSGATALPSARRG